jgi:hypothetical protein
LESQIQARINLSGPQTQVRAEHGIQGATSILLAVLDTAERRQKEPFGDWQGADHHIWAMAEGALGRTLPSPRIGTGAYDNSEPWIIQNSGCGLSAE